MSSLLNIAAGGDSGAGFYEFPIDQSLRFNGSSTYLSRTPASEGDRKHWTFSAWVKKCAVGTFQCLLSSGTVSTGSNGIFIIYFSTDDKLYVYNDANYGVYSHRFNTNAVFRDTSAWYHVVVSADADNSTTANKMRIYINGTQQTDLTTTTAFTDVNYGLSAAVEHNIGRYRYNSNGYLHGYMAEINFIDGTTLDPTSFAETKNGVWVPKDTSSLTFGSQGYRLQFSPSSVTTKFSDDFADNIDDWTNEEIGSMGVSSGNLTVTSYGSGASGGSVYGGPNIYTDVSSHNIGDFRFIIDTLSVGNVSSDLHLTQIYLTDASDNTIFTFYFSDGHVNNSNTQQISWGGHTIAGPTAGLSISSQYIIIERLGSELRLFSTLYGSYLTTGASTENVKRIYIMHKRYPGYNYPTFTLSGISIASLDNAYYEDSSGNSHDWTPVSLEDFDIISDSPTNNYCILNNLTLNAGASSSGSLSEGNLKWLGTFNNDNVFGTHAVSSGKWYYELRILAYANNLVAGWSTTQELGNYTELALVYYNSAAIRQGTKTVVWDTDVTTGLTFAVNDIIGFALDIDSGNLKVYQNNTLVSTITLPTDKGDEWIPAFGDSSTYDSSFVVNFGQDSTFVGAVTAGGYSDGNGYGDFYYAVPSGYLALNSANLPEPAISPLNNKLPEDYFNTVLYTGDDSTSQAITGVGFQPDFVWLKSRTSASLSHAILDSVRGVNKSLFPDDTSSENSGVVFPSFDSDGFTVSDSGGNWTNEDSNNFVSWNWKAGGSSPSRTYTVKVVSDSGNKYRFDDFGSSAVTLELQEGGTYIFDQSDSSNSGHPLRFSTTSNGTHGGGTEYTTGVTTAGTPGSSGAYTQIVVAASAPTLYYYCTNHSGMGGQANTNSTFGSSNFNGTIQSVDSTNTESGFSIVSYTGNTSAGATVGHGLNGVPELVIVRNRDATANWFVYHHHANGVNSSDPETDYLVLENSQARLDNANPWNDTAPTSTVFTIGANGWTNTAQNYIGYLFRSIEGFSKVSAYNGNGSTNNAFIYTGFRPAFILGKRSNAAVNWFIHDTARDVDNYTIHRLFPDLPNAENSSEAESTYGIDFLSNGFKVRASHTSTGASDAYIFLALAEMPFKYARAR
tara:strand:+ start:18632 stop:22006 length:3375 start_codon:yes stop_codon:yes gene_type:complete